MRPYRFPCGPDTTMDELLDMIDAYAEGELQTIHTRLLLAGTDINEIDLFLRARRDERPHIRARIRAEILQVLAEANKKARVEGRH